MRFAAASLRGGRASRRRRRGSRGIAAFGVASLALGLGLTPALAHADAPAGSFRVSGTVMVVPSEAAADDDASSAGDTWLATDAGPILPLDEATLERIAPPAAAISGARLTGAVSLPTRVARLVARAAARSSTPVPQQSEQMLALVADSAAATDQDLPVLAAEVAQPAASAPAGVQHQADVALLVAPGQTGLPTDAEIATLISRVSAYWTSQSGGLVAGIAAGPVKRLSVSSMQDLCSFNANWTSASAAFGRTSSSYGSAGSTRHLVMLALNPDCSVPGQGTVGSTKLNGGVSWTNLEDYTPARGAVVATQTLAHELGHNFGLGHANARVCTSGAVDAPYDAAGRVSAPCNDLEYGDLWNVMGVGIRGYTTTPAALAIDQREALGAVDGSTLRSVSASGGSAQTLTLQALTASSGVRGLRVQAEKGEPFYVEYRNGTGQDAGMPQARGTAARVRLCQTVLVKGAPTCVRRMLSAATGVRVVKLRETSTGTGSATMSRKLSDQYRQTFTTGNRVRLAEGTAQLTVLSIGSGSATVRIDFADPFLPVAQAITGTARVGDTLRASTASWSPKPERLRYQWLRGGVAVAGATSGAYRLTANDAGRRISVRVTGTRNGRSVTATSRSTGKVLRVLKTVKPGVSGALRTGARLTAHHGSWKPGGVRFSYRWLRNGKPIGGATSSRYRLKAADRGQRISVKVTGKKTGYATISRTSSKRRVSAA